MRASEVLNEVSCENDVSCNEELRSAMGVWEIDYLSVRQNAMGLCESVIL